MMDLLTRRAALAPSTNPNGQVDYISVLSGRLRGGGPDLPLLTVKVRYVPDRLIVAPRIFVKYLQALGACQWDSMEACAVAFLEDFSNEVIPRWAQFVLKAPEDLTGCLEHEVILEDRQPKWDNPTLLSRLKHY